MIWYVGDIHGRLDAVSNIHQAAQHAGATAVVQVGDFGIYWPPDRLEGWFKRKAQKAAMRGASAGPVWYTALGNHDVWPEVLRRPVNPDGLVELAPGCFYVPRSTAVTISGIRHVFLGGAESTDKHLRTPGLDWWPEETPTREEFQAFFDVLDAGGIEVAVTHDVPRQVYTRHPDWSSFPTAVALTRIAELLSEGSLPKRWFSGHHHVLRSETFRGVDFYLCGLHGQGWRPQVGGGWEKFGPAVREW